ncbi:MULTISPECIES: hypothetical protein [Pseudomonas]|uniref:hypothetical protein n=1 Tax=Pseudomonas TaxID=286 RepID=UPI0009436F03|nr:MULTISPECIES: hypothetical protein [Pseudomonas]
MNKTSVLLSALPAAIFYGLLAAVSNSAHSMKVMGLAAITQGLISYVSTLIALSVMFKLAQMLAGWHALARRAVVPLTVVSLFSALSAAVHIGAGTPNVLLTIAPSFLIGWGYFTTVYWLKDSNRSFRTPGRSS